MSTPDSTSTQPSIQPALCPETKDLNPKVKNQHLLTVKPCGMHIDQKWLLIGSPYSGSISLEGHDDKIKPICKSTVGLTSRYWHSCRWLQKQPTAYTIRACRQLKLDHFTWMQTLSYHMSNTDSWVTEAPHSFQRQQRDNHWYSRLDSHYFTANPM